MVEQSESHPIETPQPDLRQPGVYRELRSQKREPAIVRMGSAIDSAHKQGGEDDGGTSDQYEMQEAMSEVVFLLIPSADGSPTEPTKIGLSEAREIYEIGAKLPRFP